MHDDQRQDDLLAASIIKTMVLICARNTKLEDIHANAARETEPATGHSP